MRIDIATNRIGKGFLPTAAWGARDYRALLWLIVATVIIFGKGLTIGGPRWGDAGTHAMDGVLIHDWVAAGPPAWIDPWGFAEQQYAHYPSLGIGSTYPPGFAVVEAAFFAVFGVSTITARLCVLCFSLLAVAGTFVLLRRFTGRSASCFAVVALFSMPSIVDWTRQIMLEMPTLAVLIWATVAGFRYLDCPRWGRLTLWVALTIAATMFKQTAAFILLPNAVMLTVWVCKRRAPKAHLLAAALTSIGAVGAYYVAIASRSGGSPQVLHYILYGGSFNDMLGARSWLTFAGWLPEQAGWLAIVLAGTGLVIALRRPNVYVLFILLWFISFYVQVSLIQHKQPRYFFLGLWPLAVFAGISFSIAFRIFGTGRIRRLAVGAVALVIFGLAYQRTILYRPDYRPLVAAHRETIEGNIVFFDGLRDSDFIFAVRQELGPRRCVIVRGSKLLYSCAAVPRDKFESYVDSPGAVSAALHEFAFAGLFVERYPKMNLEHERWLRESLAGSEDYKLEESHTLNAGPGVAPRLRSRVAVDVYVPRHPVDRTVRTYEIPVPMDRRVVSVDLDALLGGN